MSHPSVARHHTDWLSLVEVSGPFVSVPVLVRNFPQGLEPRDPAQAKALRAAYEEWEVDPASSGSQRAWVMYVLTAVLGYTPALISEGQTLAAGLEARMPEMGEKLRPDFAIVGTVGGAMGGQAQLLIASYPVEQSLDKPVTGKHWKATPATRMMELLHGVGVPLGLVTNGEHWMLVHASRGETTGYASWYGALWLDEPITLRAFHSLLGVRRFFGVATDCTLLALLKESANDQQEVTDQLGFQVREAVEVLVKSIDALDRENHLALLKDIPETVLYDAALTIMMRLVFLFAAEERGLLHLGKSLYDDNYAVSTLQEQLQGIADQHGEEVLERRFDAWTRLLATFRAVHGGIQHQDLLMLAYGGSLFDPDRYPFLEGRSPQSSWRASAAAPLAVNNRVVLHLLNSLQRLQVKVPGGGRAESRRISFRALGVEQIGHVYEGLLDRTAVRASEPVLGINGARHRERDFSLSTLGSLFNQGREKLIEFLKEETGRSLSALGHTLDEVSLLNEHRLLIACGHDKQLLERVRPFANLIREDSFGRPLVTLNGSIYVTAATTRRSTGTHYTPPSLTEPIVQRTMEPLVYEGPAVGLPREQWKLKSPNALLSLKVCDMAMGSGAFLVQACRYMAERLVEAWENLEKQHVGEVLITPEGTFSTGLPGERLVPADINERIAIARRLIADRCLYGVDINPMAVEMAKLSLWLITLQRDRPFNFLDHALKCGDSLLGVISVKQIENFSLRPGERQITFATANLAGYVEVATAKRRALEHLPSNDQIQIETKNRLHDEAEAATARIRALADCLFAYELRGFDGNTYEEQRTVAAERAELDMRKPLQEFQDCASEQMLGRRTFHWPLEFPEVCAGGGFDAFVGNPPFMGGLKISTALGYDYRAIIVAAVASGKRGTADLCAYFFLRAGRLLGHSGCFGLVATNTVGQGDTREIGLDQLAESFSFFRASSSRDWPGAAGVTIAEVWGYKGAWQGECVLNDASVGGITTYLSEGNSRKPYALSENLQKCFVGSHVVGMGFVLEEEEAKTLLRKSPGSQSVVFPYTTGEDLNTRPDQSPSRWVINFADYPLDQQSAPNGYSGPFASDYPECLSIVEARVKPERLLNNAPALRTNWWRLKRPTVDLYRTVKPLRRVILRALSGKHHVFAFGVTGVVYDQTLLVFAFENPSFLTILQSGIHEAWAVRYSATLRETPRYIQTDCFETFPSPLYTEQLELSGSNYCEHRQSIMLRRQEGLTKTCNHFHNPDEKSEDIAKLRSLQVQMDRAVAAAYVWEDLDLGHGFHETRQGVRYTISETARRIVLDRLLALNHQRYAQEENEKAARAVSAPVKRVRKKMEKADKLTLDLL